MEIEEIFDKNDLPQEVIINSFSKPYKVAYKLIDGDKVHYLLVKNDNEVMIHTYSKTSGYYLNLVEDTLEFIEWLIRC